MSHLKRNTRADNGDLSETNRLSVPNDEVDDEYKDEECDSIYLNNFSVVKDPHRVKIGLPLSNNDMHLHREPFPNSP
jgi:hypothetical protein